MKVREDKIGCITFSKTYNSAIKVSEDHSELLFLEKRYEFLEEFEAPGALKPLSDLSLKELRERAKDIEGFKNSLKKQQLIDLIQNVTHND